MSSILVIYMLILSVILVLFVLDIFQFSVFDGLLTLLRTLRIEIWLIILTVGMEIEIGMLVLDNRCVPKVRYILWLESSSCTHLLSTFLLIPVLIHSIFLYAIIDNLLIDDTGIYDPIERDELLIYNLI
jgi:hypothetical protein